MSAYSYFADFYDELTENVGYKERAEYFSALLHSYGIAGGTVLDLACGTGSLTLELSAHGYEMIGVDASIEMLSQAQNKAAQSGENIMFLCQQMQNLDLYGTVDAAVCTLDSINHLTDIRDVQAVFDRLGLFVAPGGMFIFDVNTVYKHRCVLADNVFVYEYPDVLCLWRNAFDYESNTVDITLDFFVENEDGSYTRETENFSERAYEAEELCTMLDRSGFEVEGIFNELSHAAPPNDAQRIVIAARRR